MHAVNLYSFTFNGRTIKNHYLLSHKMTVDESMECIPAKNARNVNILHNMHMHKTQHSLNTGINHPGDNWLKASQVHSHARRADDVLEHTSMHGQL